jgi:hypothetical protein
MMEGIMWGEMIREIIALGLLTFIALCCAEMKGAVVVICRLMREGIGVDVTVLEKKQGKNK